MQVVEDKDGEDHIIIVRVINIIMISQVPGGSGHAVHCSLLFHQGEAFSQEVQVRANFTNNLMNSFLPEHLFKTETNRSHIDDVQERYKIKIMPKV